MLFTFSLQTQQYEALLEKYHDSTLPPDSPNLFIKSVVLKALETPPDIGDRLSDMEDRLEELEGTQGALSHEDLERLAKILSRDYLGDRLSALEGDKQETAIMIQKRHSPAPVIPEITYSHEQAATEWQRTTATVKRWASKPEKWPQGWLFDADKQFWVRTA